MRISARIWQVLPCLVACFRSCSSLSITLPRHSNPKVNDILQRTESSLERPLTPPIVDDTDRIFANNYVDLGKINSIGFDFDYTLVTYTDDLLRLIYERALDRLVNDRQYPTGLFSTSYENSFSIRGLAVDTVTGWICHLSYTHKVTRAFEGRTLVPTSRIYEEYNLHRALTPSERKKRLKPLNDLFSMAECCLIANVIQYFNDSKIPYLAKNVVKDVLTAIRDTHLSGEFHRIVAQDPQKYLHQPSDELPEMISNLSKCKQLVLVSNSPYWYVDAGMTHVFGEGWQSSWDAIICTAGKPTFYTDKDRPFREVSGNRLQFHPVTQFEPGKVYSEGCFKELKRLLDEPNMLYIGDSLFADLVDAKREFGVVSACVVPEVSEEVSKSVDFFETKWALNQLLHCLREVQQVMGTGMRTEEDVSILDALEKQVSKCRDMETKLSGNPFGSVFRARYQPSLFAHSLRRYCDLYMPSVSCLHLYSPQHRFYPDQNHRLLAHEMETASEECWNLDPPVVFVDGTVSKSVDA